MIINLRDYRNSNSIFEYDLITRTFSKSKIRPKSTNGYFFLKNKRFYSRREIFAAIFISNQSIFVVLNSKQYEINQISDVRFGVKKCLGLSVFRQFFIIENGIHIDQTNYISFSSSEEEWPDGYSDIFRFIANTLSGKFDLVLLRNILSESNLEN